MNGFFEELKEQRWDDHRFITTAASTSRSTS